MRIIDSSTRSMRHVLPFLLAAFTLVCCFPARTAAQGSHPKTSRFTLYGKVIDAVSKEPIVGASVWVKETTSGTTSGTDGSYTLTVEANPETAVVVASFIGFETVEETLKGRTNINFSLGENSSELEDLVVVGYGTQRKESVIGAISTVKSSDLRLPTAQLSTSLAGQIAGVVSIQRSGEPGSHSDFWIRGISSLNEDSRKPLILVDGIERELDLVDVEDIQTFNVLKDATATAVYGVRGANGVVLITTRTGESGAPKVSIRSEVGIVQPTNMPKFVNSEQLVRLYNEAHAYENNGAKYYDDETVQKYTDQSDPDLYPDVDWINELFKPLSSNQRVNANVSGGNDVITYYVSGGFYNEGSIYKNDNLQQYKTSINYNKFNFRANLDIKLSPTTILNVNLSNIYETKNAPTTSTEDIWKSAYTVSPHIIPMRYSNGYLAATQGSSTGANPYNLITQQGYQNVYANNSQALVGLTKDFGRIVTPGLKFNIKFSWDAVTGQTQKYNANPQTWIATGRDADGNLEFDEVKAGSNKMDYSKESSGTKINYLEASLNYDRAFRMHRVGALLLFNQKSEKDIQASNIDKSRPYRHQGIAGRLTYSFNDRYFVEGNFGYNGSENFSPGKRFGFFPSVALGWMISNERFFEPVVNVIDMLKIRGSYGLVGNDRIGANRRFIYNGTFSDVSSAYLFGNGTSAVTGVRFNEFANPGVSWETSRKLDVGVEVSFFKSLRIHADYFSDSRSGIFLRLNGISSVLGLNSTPYINFGKTQNKGFDIEMEGNRRIGEVSLSLRGNLTYNRNKVIENAEAPEWYPYLDLRQRVIGQQYGLIAEGLFSSQEEIDNSPVTSGTILVGDIKYRDTNADGTINELDYVAIGRNWMPELTYGFGLSAQWRNFDIAVFFQGVGHVTTFLNGAAVWPFSNNDIKIGKFYTEVYDKIWRVDNPDPNAEFPRASTGKNNNNTQYRSTFWQRDMSYLRLKNATLGYSLPKSILKKIGIDNTRIYLSGVNLLTFSTFKMFDPEIGNGTTSGQGNIYPPTRIISLGLNLSF